MPSLPQVVVDAWNDRQERYVFSTVDEQSNPNSVYVTWAKPLNNEQILIVNNRFEKTLQNIKTGSKGSFLFMTKDIESYQVKGSLEYYTSGKIYDEMKAWLDLQLPGLGAVILNVEEVYRGTEDLLSAR